MKFVEKKCPNCGAGLKFDDGATSVACEYCNQTFYIQKDEKKYAKVDDAHLADAYKFVDEVGKPIVKAFAAAQIGMMIVPVIIFVIAFVGILTTIFSFTKHENDNFHNNEDNGSGIIEEVEKDWEAEAEKKFQEARKKIVIKLEQIDKTSLDTFYDNAVLELENYDGSNRNYKISSDWKAYGAYLLVGKETNKNYLYVLCKHTYKHRTKGKTVTLYAAVKFDDLKLTEDGIVNNDFDGWSEAPSIDLDGDKFEWAYGYESEEKLYNSLVRGQSGTYTIEATEGIYVEANK